jgi:hypothetical protein
MGHGTSKTSSQIRNAETKGNGTMNNQEVTTPESVETANRVHGHREVRANVINSRIFTELMEEVEEFPDQKE